jgi:hypothetical protein
MSIDFPWPALDFRQRPAMKAASLLEHFQGHLVRIFDRLFHIPVIHLQRNWKQRAREMIENRDRIFSFHQTSVPTPSYLATCSGVAEWEDGFPAADGDLPVSCEEEFEKILR